MWYWLVYLLLMAWSRMYGGVHYPQDVIAGLILGSAVAIGIYSMRDALARLWSQIPSIAAIVFLVVAGALMAWLLVADEAGVSGAGILIGGGLGVMFEARRVRFTMPDNTRQRILRFIAGIVMTLIVFLALDVAFESLSPESVFRVVRYGWVSLVILGLYPWVMVRAGLAASQQS